MTIKKFIILIAFIFLLIACSWFAYLWIDRSITLSYTNQEFESCIKSENALASLLEQEWRGKKKSEVIKILQNEVDKDLNKKSFLIIKNDGEEIWLNQIRFNFENDRLKNINSEFDD